MNDRPHYPWNEGDELFATELNAAIANMGAAGTFVPVSGGSMTGPLTLAGNATLPLHAVPLQQLTAATSGGPFLPLAGGVLGASLTLAGNATLSLHAVPLQQLNSTMANFLPLSGGVLTGGLGVIGTTTLLTATAATPATADNSTNIATTAFVKAQGYQTAAQVTTALVPYAPLASPPLTGVPTAPTAALGTATTQIATTAFVNSARQPNFHAFLSATQTVTTAVNTKVQFNTKVFDSASAYDNTTNYRFTPQVAGKYRVTVNLLVTLSGTASGTYAALIYKNGTEVTRSQGITPNTNSFSNTQIVTAIISMNGTTDYLEGWGLATGVTVASIGGGGGAGGGYSFFEAEFVGA